MLQQLDRIITLLHQANKQSKKTPHLLMELLKKPVKNDNNRETLTTLGAFIKEALKTSQKEDLFDILGWVVFHLDYPGNPFGNNLRASRNWIAMKYNDDYDNEGYSTKGDKIEHDERQRWVDDMHDKTVGMSEYDLEEVYAPSLLCQKISKTPWHRYSDLIWLLRPPLTHKKSREKTDNLLNEIITNCPLRNDKITSGKCLCLLPDFELHNIYIQHCGCSPKPSYLPKPVLLSDILKDEFPNYSPLELQELVLTDIPAHKVAQRVLNFYDCIFPIPPELIEPNNIYGYKRHDIISSNPDNFGGRTFCNYYMRVPVRKESNISGSISDIYFSLHDKERNPTKLLDCITHIVPALKTCIALINGELAYSLGEGRGHVQILHSTKNKLGGIERHFHSDIMKMVAQEKESKRYTRAVNSLRQATHQIDTLYRVTEEKHIDSENIIVENFLKYHNRKILELQSIIFYNRPDITISSLSFPQTEMLNNASHLKFFVELYDILLEEILNNLSIVSAVSEDVTFKLIAGRSGSIALQVRNKCKKRFLLTSEMISKMLAERGEIRMRGLGIIELIQQHCKIHYWECQHAGYDHNSVIFTYPFAKIIEKK